MTEQPSHSVKKKSLVIKYKTRLFLFIATSRPRKNKSPRIAGAFEIGAICQSII